jgi:hypothetical protein
MQLQLLILVQEIQSVQPQVRLLLLFFKFSIFNCYNIYRTAILALITKVSYIPKSVRSEISIFSAFLTIIPLDFGLLFVANCARIHLLFLSHILSMYEQFESRGENSCIAYLIHLAQILRKLI